MLSINGILWYHRHQKGSIILHVSGSSITSFSAKRDKTKQKLFSISEIMETHWYTGN